MDRTRSPYVPLVSPRHIAALKEAQFTYAVAHTKPEGTLEYFRQLREASLHLLKQAFVTADAQAQEASVKVALPPIPPEVLAHYASTDEASGS